MAKQKPNGAIAESHVKGSHPEGYMQACADVLRAIEAKDVNLLADSLKAACELIDEEPHVEGPHEDE